jgi:hypothetical protein
LQALDLRGLLQQRTVIVRHADSQHEAHRLIRWFSRSSHAESVATNNPFVKGLSIDLWCIRCYNKDR